MKELLTQEEMCGKLQIDMTTLWKLRKMGMPYIRLGKRLIRYDFDDVVEWLKFKGVRV